MMLSSSCSTSYSSVIKKKKNDDVNDVVLLKGTRKSNNHHQQQQQEDIMMTRLVVAVVLVVMIMIMLLMIAAIISLISSSPSFHNQRYHYYYYNQHFVFAYSALTTTAKHSYSSSRRRASSYLRQRHHGGNIDGIFLGSGGRGRHRGLFNLVLLQRQRQRRQLAATTNKGINTEGDSSSSSPSLSSTPSLFGTTTKNVATQILQGAGIPQVDMNIYNLANIMSVDEVVEQWTAKYVERINGRISRDVDSNNKNNNGVYLRCKNDREHYVDVVIVRLPPRTIESSGLGILLTEIAGGPIANKATTSKVESERAGVAGDDNDRQLGITVVSGLVEDGPAQTSSADIYIGDSLAQVALVRQRRQQQSGGLSVDESEQRYVVSTECLSYDATVKAIQSLPSPLQPSKGEDDGYEEEEYFELTLKRLRRKPMVEVKLQYPPSQNEPDTTIQMFAGENLRQGMLIRGVKLNDPLAKRFDTKTGGNCGAGGLCRTCAVSISTGKELLNDQRPAEQQMLRDEPRWRLACKAVVGYGMKEGQIQIRVNPRQWD